MMHGPLDVKLYYSSYPRNNELPTDVLHISLYFGCYIHLVAVKGNSLEVSQ